MCYDWGLEEKGRLTTDCRATPIWVASMNQINFKAISAMKKKGNYSKVVAFQPTGWSHGMNLLNLILSIKNGNK